MIKIEEEEGIFKRSKELQNENAMREKK